MLQVPFLCSPKEFSHTTDFHAIFDLNPRRAFTLKGMKSMKISDGFSIARHYSCRNDSFIKLHLFFAL